MGRSDGKSVKSIKNVELTQSQFKKYGLGYEQQSVSELVDIEINNKNIIIDERNIRTKNSSR